MRRNRRRLLFIEKKFQIQFIIKFCLLVTLGSLATMALLYFFASRTTTVSFQNTRAVVKSTADFIFPILVQTLLVVTILIALSTIMLTLLISHRIAGPLYRFKKELLKMKGGHLESEFKIRKGDQLQELAEILNELKCQYREDIAEIKSSCQELESSISKLKLSPEESSLLREALDKLREKINCYQT